MLCILLYHTVTATDPVYDCDNASLCILKVSTYRTILLDFNRDITSCITTVWSYRIFFGDADYYIIKYLKKIFYSAFDMNWCWESSRRCSLVWVPRHSSWHFKFRGCHDICRYSTWFALLSQFLIIGFAFGTFWHLYSNGCYIQDDALHIRLQSSISTGDSCDKIKMCLSI